MHPVRTLVRVATTSAFLLLAGCIPPPADIGVDYSGPIYRKPGADAPRVVTDAPVLPVTATPGCSPIQDVPSRKRSECSVRAVMERVNVGLQTMYQKRLVIDPMMQGKVTLRLLIAPGGNVQSVDVASSDIRDTAFTRDIVDYVRQVNFDALDNVPMWSDTYTVEFTPPKDVIPDKPVPIKPKTPAPGTGAAAQAPAAADAAPAGNAK